MRGDSAVAEGRDRCEPSPLPCRRPDDEREGLIVSEVDHLAKNDRHGFGGRRDFTRPLRVLIAGVGTGDALVSRAAQVRGAPREVVFLDRSERSLEIVRARCAARGKGGRTPLGPEPRSGHVRSPPGARGAPRGECLAELRSWRPGQRAAARIRCGTTAR